MAVAPVAALTTPLVADVAVLLLSLLTLHLTLIQIQTTNSLMHYLIPIVLNVKLKILGSQFDHFDLDSESGQSSDKSELEDNGLDQFVEQNNVDRIYSPLSK